MRAAIRNGAFMINTKLTAAAANLARQVHGGEVDRTGGLALDHYFSTANAFDTEEEVCVALLCDVLTTGKAAADDLASIGMPDEVIKAVEVLARAEGEDFFAYAERVKCDPLAARVKRADLAQRVSDMDSYVSMTGYDRRRRTSYLKAIDIIDGVDAVAYDGLFESQHHHGQLKTPVPAAPKPPVQH